jgi:hypothetical protein
MTILDPKLTFTPRRRSDGKWYVEASGPDSIPRAIGEFFAEWEAKIWIQNARRRIADQGPQTPLALQPDGKFVVDGAIA